ncbi:MAG TPA: sigma 54-interacting transcriptional regulator [Vicinamibacterales bacterium]|nr:sigma 54-interacting transcriptional regulator [Vicinamibacterales bacterium]
MPLCFFLVNTPADGRLTTRMPAQTNPYELYQTGRYAEALKFLREEASWPLDTSDNVLLSELLWLRGEVEPARSLAASLLGRRDLTTTQKCGVRYVLGQVYFAKGDSTRGAEHFRIGAELAMQAGDVREECRLRVHLFLKELHLFAPHHIGTDLDGLKRKVHHAADPATSALFHLGLTELAAKLALLPQARSHLETARALLPTVANLAVHSKLRFTEFVLCAEEGYVAEALELALAFAAGEDADVLKTHLPVVVARLCILGARFDEAEHWLQRGLQMAPAGGAIELNLHDTFMTLKLAQGRLDEAAEWDRAVRRLTDAGHFQDSYFGLWPLLTRVRWLYQRGQVRDGLSVAREAMPRLDRLAHHSLLALMNLLTAEGLGLTDRPAEGAAIVAKVLAVNRDPSVEILAEVLRVIGGLAATQAPDLAASYYDRAEEMLRLVGNVTGANAVVADRKRRIGEVRTSRAEAAKTTAATWSATWSERVATLLSVGSHPAILAAQARAIITDSGAAESVRLVEAAAGNAPPPAGDTAGQMRIALGTHRDTAYELHVTPKVTAADRATLLNLARIIQASIDLSRARQSEREQAALWPEPIADLQLGLVCASERMLDIMKVVRRVAPSNATVLVTGETGVGKELLARAIHHASTRSNRAFRPVNCGTVAGELFDTTVIGPADGGTLFLDDVGDLALDTQPKLLRFLDSSEVASAVDGKPRPVDVRIVAATSANLDELVANGRFREDLYYRLNVIRINVPALRDRREEIPALVAHFIERFGRELQKPMLRMADETLEYLMLYRWPGNVRQLANEIRRLVATAEPGSVIMPAHLADDIAESRRTFAVNQSARLFHEVVTRIDQPLSAAVEHIERTAIQRALTMAGGRVDDAAKSLGLSRKGLYLKRQRLGLE